MKSCKLILRIDSEKLNKLLESAIDNFKDMEANHLHDVDLEKCVSDYISAVLIFNQSVFKLEQVDL